MSCTYAKRRGVCRSYFELRTNFLPFFACVFALAGYTGISYAGVGVKHQAAQRCGGMVCCCCWYGSMVCIGKNIANCSKNPQFLPVMCALCPCCVRTPP